MSLRAIARASCLLLSPLLPLTGCASIAGTPREVLVVAGDAAAIAATLPAGSTVVIRVEERDALDQVAAAARALIADGACRVGYWIEVARAPSLADAHPMRMASLQGHEEWREQFPDTATPTPGEVVKVWPWVPITTEEGFALQLARVASVLDALPPAQTIFLNDLQAAPSACGCGHPLCRWATDYFLKTDAHPVAIPSGTPLGPDAAAHFVERVAAVATSAAKSAAIVPVWVPECADGDERCHGVPCFAGRCWPAMHEQLAPLRASVARIAMLVPDAPVADAGVDADAATAAVAESTAGAETVVWTVVGATGLDCRVGIDQSWAPRVIGAMERDRPAAPAGS